MKKTESLFPLFLKLRHRKVLVVGGGRVAAAKIRSLLKARALVTVVAPEISREIEESGVNLIRRPFQWNDLEGIWFVVAAATTEANRQVAEAAEDRRIFINAVDDRSHASAYAGSVLERGGVTIALSTQGDAPALAGLLREALERLLPEDLENWSQAAAALRERQKANGVPVGQRRPLLLDALNELYAASQPPQRSKNRALQEVER